jgi:group I intron endonuclease
MRGIYRIENLIDWKEYYGSSVDIAKRWDDHRSALRHNKHYNPHLQRAWNKYGEAAFSFQIIEDLDGETDDYLLEREQWYLDNTQCLDPQYGYNIARDAIAPMAGRKLTAEHKDKIRQAHLGKKHTPEAIEKTRQFNLGRAFTPEHIDKLRQAHLGKTLTPEHKEKIRQFRSTPESRERMRQVQKARWKH